MGKYHKGIRIEGADEFLLAVNITGHGAPTEDTEAEPGMCYLDEDSEHGDLYKCIGVLVTETRTVYRWKKLAGQEEVERLSEAIGDKANKAGWTPDKYIGTDAEGNLVEKDAPAGGGDGTSDLLSVAGTKRPGYFVGLTDNLTPTWMSKEGEIYYAEEDFVNLATAENTVFDGRINHSINSLGGNITDTNVIIYETGAHAKIEIPENASIICIRYKVMGMQRNYTGNFIFTDENGVILWARNYSGTSTTTADGWCLPTEPLVGVGTGVTGAIEDTGVSFDISALTGAKYLYFTTVRYDNLAATDIEVYVNGFPDTVKTYDTWFVLGDSLSSPADETRYYDYILNHLGKTVDLKILAVGSKNSTEVISEQIPQIAEIAEKRNLITCMIGTNDTFNTDDAFRENIGNIISAVQTGHANSTLVMITNPPRFDTYQEKMLSNADIIKSVCAEKNIKCIDFYHECGFAETNLAYFFKGDKLHLTVEGQRILATLLEPFVHSFFTI